MPIELSFFSYVNSLKVAVCELFVCFLKGSEVTKERERELRGFSYGGPWQSEGDFRVRVKG